MPGGERVTRLGPDGIPITYVQNQPGDPNFGGEDFLSQSREKKPTVFEQAGQLQSEAALEGSEFEQGFLEQAIAQLQGFGGFAPYQQAGAQGLAGLQQGSTAQGMDQRLAEIMSGDAFGSLVDERTRGVQGQLAAGGLTRSGRGIAEAAAVPQDVALALEGLLTGRQANLANTGFQAAGAQSGLETGIANILGRQGQVGSQGITGSAEALASGILGEKAYQTQRDSNKPNSMDYINTGLKIYGATQGVPTGGCVIATHAVESGAFSKDDKAKAVKWCKKALHGSWWGEAFRRGYRYIGNKKIEKGVANQSYDEFKQFIDFVTGRKRTLKVGIKVVLRSIQLFVIGLFVKEK